MLLYFDCAILLPLPTFARAGDGAVMAFALVARPRFRASHTAPLRHLEQLHAAAKDREPEKREHERFLTFGDHWHKRLSRLARRVFGSPGR